MTREARHHRNGERIPGGRRRAWSVIVLIGGATACAGLPVEQVGELRRQVDQLARQRADLVGEARALGETARDRDAAGPVTGQGPSADAGSAGSLEHYRRGYAFYHQGDYAAAGAALRAFLSAVPGDHPAAADARYWIGECYFARGLYHEAIGAWGALAEARDAAARPDRAWLRIGTAYARLGETGMARLALGKVAQLWPDGDSASQAIEELGRLPEER